MDPNSIPERCIGCPSLAFYQENIDNVARESEAALRGGMQAMQGDDTFESFQTRRQEIDRESLSPMQRKQLDEIERKLDELAPGFKESSREVRETTEEFLKAQENIGSFCEKVMGELVANCESGPVTGRRFGLIGRQVIKCGSRIASSAGRHYYDIHREDS